MVNLVEKITDEKLNEVVRSQKLVPLAEIREQVLKMGPCRPFKAALSKKLEQGAYGIIAEIKHSSPSAGIIRKDFSPKQHAKDYETSGVDCLSVLTDKHFFKGNFDHLQEARQACHLPVLRKDFILHEYQVYQTRAIGADCILLIVRFLDSHKLQGFHDLAKGLGLDVLIEVHNEQEMDAALAVNADLVGINNRDLDNFSVDTNVTRRLATYAQSLSNSLDITLVSESGICNRQQLLEIYESGVGCFLIGSYFMRQQNIIKAVRDLVAL